MPNTALQFETIQAKDLLTQPIAPLEFTIDGILPHGLFILAGSSKVGKSWLALDISSCVAEGNDFWHYPTTQGDVLYLALEDTHARLQERLNKVSPECDLESATDIHFTTRAQRLGDGLSEQITAFLETHPHTKLIVIDTLQYIRNPGKSGGTYSRDYQDMNALREIISGRKLTMLLLTHNHKSGDADPVNRVIGSTGLTGAVDGIFVLEKNKRVGDMAKLTITNRDTESHQFDLRFDSENCRWQFVGEASENGENQLYELLGFLLDETVSWSGTATQLSAALAELDTAFSISPIVLSKALKQQQEFLESQHGIICIFTRSKSMRLIELSRGTSDKFIVLHENAYEVKPA